MAGQSAEQFFSSIPPITKYITGFSFAMTLATALKIVHPLSLILSFEHIFSSKLQLWRIFTGAVYFGGFSINFVFNFLFFLNFLKGKFSWTKNISDLEKEHYERRPADFVFLMFFGWSIILPLGLFFELPILSYALMSYVVYIACNMNPEREIGLFMIPIQVKGYYFPWALLLLHTLMGASPTDDIIGILVGHLFYFLDVKHPLISGKRYLKTPQIFHKWFPATSANIYGMGGAVHHQAPQQQPQYFGGVGRRLGG